MGIKVALAGVGNCTSALIQGVEFYKEAKKNGQSVDVLMKIVALTIFVFGGATILIYFTSEVYILKAMEKAYHHAVYLVPFTVISQLLKGSYIFPHFSIWLSKKTYFFQ